VPSFARLGGWGHPPYVVFATPLRAALAFLSSSQILQLHHELLYVLEIQINRGKAHIGYLVVPTQSVHDQFAQLAGFALAFGRFDYKSFRLIYNLLQLADPNRSLLARPQQAIQYLLAIEFLPAAVFLTTM